MPATFEPIATATGTGASGTITFSSISGYTDIRAVLQGTTSAVTDIGMRFNGGTGSNYYSGWILGNGTSASAVVDSVQTRSYLNSAISTSTTVPGLWILDIFNYASGLNTTSLSTAYIDRNGTGSIEKAVMLWTGGAAVTSISFLTGSGFFSTNFTATLYGIKAA